MFPEDLREYLTQILMASNSQSSTEGGSGPHKIILGMCIKCITDGAQSPQETLRCKV